MAKNDIYTVRSIVNQPLHWLILKCDLDFNPTGSYIVSKSPHSYNCDCFAGNKPTCRHRMLLLEFQIEKRIDSNWWMHVDHTKKQPLWLEGPNQQV